MEKITLYIGLNDKDSKTQKIDTVEAVKITTNILTMFTNGVTIYNATGIYKHDNGQIIIENTLRVELIEIDSVKLDKAITILKQCLNQESIIKQIENINTVIA